MSVYRALRRLPAPAWPTLRRAILWMLAAAVLDGLAGLALVPVVLAWFAPAVGAWHTPLAVLLGVTAVQVAVAYAAQRRGYLGGAGLAVGLVSGLLAHVPRLPRGHGHGHGQALAGGQSLAGLVAGPVFHCMGLPAHLLAPLIAALVTPLVMILGLFAFAPLLAGLLALAYLPLFCLLRWAGQRSLALERQRQAVDADVGQRLQLFAEQQALLRSSSEHGPGQRALRQALDQQHQVSLELNRRSLPASLGFAAAVQLVFSALLVGGVLAVSTSQLSGPLLIAVMLLSLRFIEPLSQLAQLDQALRMAWQALLQVLGVLATPALQSPEPGLQPHDVSLSAQGLRWVTAENAVLLEDIDLDCPAGSFTAIVGPSGAGKSTLLSLLGRAADPEAGVVRLGQVDVRQLSERTLAEHLTSVLQDCGLFAGTLAWNVAMARPDATAVQLQAAADATGLDEAIATLPGGWQGEVGPGGGLLSGGQRQRASLARALLSQAPVLLLDEPTASLDARNVTRVNQSLRRLAGRRTLVLVSHDPQLVCDADQIVVLEAGRITGCGSHEWLLATHPWYARFAVQ